MLIKESEIMSSPLDDIQYIEQPISEATIPVTENSRLGKYVVSVEDITQFCEDTNSDPGYVISQICESNGIETDTLAFSVKEESVILGESAANISVALMNEGADVLAAPTSHNWLWMAIGEGIQEKFGIPLDEVTYKWMRNKIGMDQAFDDKIDSKSATSKDLSISVAAKNGIHKLTRGGDSTELDTFLNGTDDDRELRGFLLRNEHKGHVGRETNKIERMAHRANNQADKLMQNSEDSTKDMENFEKKMQDEIDALHRSNNKNLIAKGLAKLHDWAKRLNEKYKETKVSGPKTAIKKALSWITGVIASLTRRLHNLTTKKENAIND